MKSFRLVLAACLFSVLGLVGLIGLAGCSPNYLPNTTLIETELSIPTLDLTLETGLHTVVDREDGQYLGHPTTVLLNDGTTVLATYPKGHGSGPIVYKKSLDGGLTWSERLQTPLSWASSKEVPTLYKITTEDNSSRLLLFSGLYPIRLSISDDEGVSWTELEPIGAFGGIVAMSSLVRLKTGQLAAFFHDDERFFADGGQAGVFTVYKTLSEDNGLTWSEPTQVIRHEQMDLCEPGVVRSPNGDELAMLLRENSRTAPSQIIFTTNEAETWTNPVALPESLTGDRHTIRYLHDGRLIIVFRDMLPDSPTKGDWVAWIGTWEDLRHGQDGAYRIRILDNRNAWDSTYPGVEILPDGSVLTTTYGHWEVGQEPYIVSARLSLLELDSRVHTLTQ